MQDHDWTPWQRQFGDLVARCRACTLAVWVQPWLDRQRGDLTVKAQQQAALRIVGATCPGSPPKKGRTHSLTLRVPDPTKAVGLALECPCDRVVLDGGVLAVDHCRAS